MSSRPTMKENGPRGLMVPSQLGLPLKEKINSSLGTRQHVSVDVRASSLAKGTNSTFFLTYVRKEQNGLSTHGCEDVASMMALVENLQKI